MRTKQQQRARNNLYYRRWYAKHRSKEAREKQARKQEYAEHRRTNQAWLEAISQSLVMLVEAQKRQTEKEIEREAHLL